MALRKQPLPVNIKGGATNVVSGEIDVNARTLAPPNTHDGSFLAPIAGWDTFTPTARPQPNTAFVMENFIPTSLGVKPRGGSKLMVRSWNASDVTDPDNPVYDSSDIVFTGPLKGKYAKTIFEIEEDIYVAGNQKIFKLEEESGAFTMTEAHALDVGEPTHPSILAYTTPAGTKSIYYVDKLNSGVVYDGTDWETFTFETISSKLLSHIWVHSRRIWFVEGGTLTAWYLSTGVSPAAGTTGASAVANPSHFRLGGVFGKSTELLFGATWSSDSGEGFDDRCVFVTKEGEIAIYVGTDPSDINNWELQGVYTIPRPLGPRCHLNIGGDLIIGTALGLISLNEAVQRDESALELSTMSLPIYNELYTDIAREDSDPGSVSDWELVKWEKEGLLIFHDRGASENLQQYVVNTETRAWCKLKGWDARTIFSSRTGITFYSDRNGALIEMGVGGSDEDRNLKYRPGYPAYYNCRLCWAFVSPDPEHDDVTVLNLTFYARSPGGVKLHDALGPLWKFGVAKDYKTSFPEDIEVDRTTSGVHKLDGVAYENQYVGNREGPKWGVALWDEEQWTQHSINFNESATPVISLNESYVDVEGYKVAPQVLFRSFSMDKPEWSIVDAVMRFKVTSPKHKHRSGPSVN